MRGDGRTRAGERGFADRITKLGQRMLRRAVDTPATDPAPIVERIAALLGGGVPPARVIDIVMADACDAGRAAVDPGLARIAAAGAAGVRGGEAIAHADTAAWRVVAVSWCLAEASGSPIAPALHRMASALRELARMRERRSVLLAGPRATVKMVTALPLLALMLSLLLGFDPIPVLVSPVGALLGSLGLGLLTGGIAWSRALQRRVAALDHVAGLEYELVWIALGGGAPAEQACRRVIGMVDRFGAEWVSFAAFREGGALTTSIAAAARAGIAIGPLLLEQGSAVRAVALADLERDAERLGVRILIPLGVCILPAFIVLGVLPVLLSMFGAV